MALNVSPSVYDPDGGHTTSPATYTFRIQNCGAEYFTYGIASLPLLGAYSHTLKANGARLGSWRVSCANRLTNFSLPRISVAFSGVQVLNTLPLCHIDGDVSYLSGLPSCMRNCLIRRTRKYVSTSSRGNSRSRVQQERLENFYNHSIFKGFPRPCLPEEKRRPTSHPLTIVLYELERFPIRNIEWRRLVI